tara:strand:- start:69 stop:641 length:573 start_codon:yes stop_codon:yes gene_type:complete
MRIFLSFLVLIFTLQSWTKADDIRDFQIEGMSIGDNLLDFYNKNKIAIHEKNYYTNKKYIPVWIRDSNFSDYDGVQFHYKNVNGKYIIAGIEGIIAYNNNMEDCYKRMNEVDKVLIKSFPNLERVDEGISSHPADKTGKSTAKEILYWFESSDSMYVKCFDWTKKMGHFDNLRVGLKTKELNEWYKIAYD